MTTPVPTVFGVVLEPGERVVYYHREEPGWQKPFFIVLGVLTLVAFLGLFFIVAGLMATTTVYVITTKRFIKIEGKRGQKVEYLRHGDVKHVVKKVAGSILKWINMSDEHGTLLLWQVVSNKPELPALVDRALENPASLESLPTATFDSVAGPRALAN